MLKWLLLGLFLLILSGVLVGYLLVNQQIGDPTEIYTVRIQKDDSAAALRAKLEDAGLDIQPLAYSALMRLSGADKRLQPGLYKLTGALTQYELVQVFNRGEVELSRVTIPEGLPYWEVVPILANGIPTDSGRLYDLVTDAGFASHLGVEAPNLEGYLLPETYTLFAEQAPEEVLTLLVRSGLELLRSHSERLAGLNLAEHELLTLASLVEAEATANDERALISAVFHNRLRDGWKLQCDPTVRSDSDLCAGWTGSAAISQRPRFRVLLQYISELWPAAGTDLFSGPGRNQGSALSCREQLFLFCRRWPRPAHLFPHTE
jgi:UPF0755 protein